MKPASFCKCKGVLIHTISYEQRSKLLELQNHPKFYDLWQLPLNCCLPIYALKLQSVHSLLNCEFL